MRVLVTGGPGVLGSASIPLLRDAGHTVDAPAGPSSTSSTPMPSRSRLPTRTRSSTSPPGSRRPNAWPIAKPGATPIASAPRDAALAASVEWFLFPSIAFVYPESGEVDESTPVADTVPEILLSALEAERHVARFNGDGRRGVVLRLGVLYGPSIGKEMPAERWAAYGATLRIEDAGRAIAAATEIPGGVYNVVSDGERVSNERFKGTAGWRPEF